jgi:GTPase Era involved in 16S rRNA processing
MARLHCLRSMTPNYIGINGRESGGHQIRCFARNIPKRVRPVVKIEKRLDIAIIGLPNVGKSVLLNTLVREKLAATSRKANTTRREILGVFNHRNTQLVFHDTPGFMGSTPKKDKYAQKRSPEAEKTTATLNAVAEEGTADVVCIVVDSTQPFTSAYQDKFAQLVSMLHSAFP